MSEYKSNNPAPFNNFTVEEDAIDLKKIVSIIFNNWILFLVSIFICIACAYVYGYTSTRQWHASSKILVEDQKNNPTSALAGTLTGDIGSLFNVKSSADNEVQILKSRSLMSDVVKQMQLNVIWYRTSRIRETEVYDECPFKVFIKYKVDTILTKRYKIKAVSSETYQLIGMIDKTNIKAKYGDTVRLKAYDLVLNKTGAAPISDKYEFLVIAEDITVDFFSKLLTVDLSSKQSTTIDLNFNYPHPKKAESILNTLMLTYLRNNLKNKKTVADSTMNFINTRIQIVNKDLSGIEQDLQNYKEQNNIANIGDQAKALISNESDFEKKLNEQQVQLSVISSLEKIINEKRLIPSSLTIPAATAFNQSINSYNDLVLNRDKAALSLTPNNPIYKNIDQQIESARNGLIANVESYKKSLIVATSQLQRQNNSFNGQLKEVPKKERIYLDYTRRQQLQQELYLYLLQKKEETAISKTSTISSSRILDYAKSDFTPFSPQKNTIYAIGLLLGLIIPSAFLFVKELLNIKINNKGDIERLTSTPVIGEISHNEEKKSLIVVKESRSIISEQFRSLRTNLQYALDSSKSNVLLFTSSMSGEGKSFLSLNLGSALALTDKKVVFLELDLRKPKLSESIGLDNSNGFTNFVVSASTNINSILKPVWIDSNCYIISSGPIPPNPSELLVNEKLENLIKDLRQKFDYIIIDCAPIGLVTDALLLEKYADMVFYVVRQNYTYKSQLNIVNDLRINKRIKNMYIVINDIKVKNGGYGAYGQGYGYGYGYGVYGEDAKR